MAETDILLSVGLDTRDAIETAKDLDKEIDKTLSQKGKQSSAVAGVNSQLKEAKIKSQELRKELEQLGTRHVGSTDAYKKIKRDIQDAQTQYEEFVKQQEQYERKGETSGKYYTEVIKGKEAAAARLESLRAQKTQMKESGAAYILGKDTEEYAKKKQQLTEINDKQKQLVIRHRELEQAANKSGKTQVKSFSNVGGSIKKVLKTLKKVALRFVMIAFGIRGVFGLIRRIRSFIKSSFTELYKGDEKFKKKVDDLKADFNQLKGQIAGVFRPFVDIAIPYIQQLIQYVTKLLDLAAQFTAAATGQDKYTKAIKKSADAAAGANKQLSKLDELNNLTSDQGNVDFEQAAISAEVFDKLNALKELANSVKKALTDMLVDPFMDGLDWSGIRGKFEALIPKIQEVGQHIKNIFTDPDVLVAATQYASKVSETLGKLIGSALSIGADFANTFVDGFNQFLDQNEGDIADHIAGIFGKETNLVDQVGQLADAFKEIFGVIEDNEDAANTVKNCFQIIWDVLSTYQDTQLQVFIDLMTLHTMPITENVEQWKKAFEDLMIVLSPLSDFVSQVVSKVTEWIRKITDAVSPVVQFIAGIIAKIVGHVLTIWDMIYPVIQTVIEYLKQLWEGYISPIVSDIIDIITDLADIAITAGTWLWDKVLDPVLKWFEQFVLPVLMPILKEVFNIAIAGFKLILATIKPVFKSIKDFVAMIKAIVHGDWAAAMQSLGQFVVDLAVGPIIDIIRVFTETFSNTWQNALQYIETIKSKLGAFRDWWANLWYKIETILVKQYDALWVDSSGLLNKLKNLFANFLNGIIFGMKNAINQIISMINSMSFTVPSWLPVYGGKSFSPNLPYITWGGISIPALAQGTVIPPSMGEFIAKLGDNKQETEVVSPLSTMKQAVAEVLAETGFDRDITIELTVDGRELAKTVVRQSELYKRSTGRSMFA